MATNASGLSNVRGESRGPVVVAAPDGDVAERTIRLAASIAASRATHVQVVYARTVPEQTPPSLVDSDGAVGIVQRVTAETSGAPAPVKGSVHTGHRLGSVVADAVRTHDASLLVTDRRPPRIRRELGERVARATGTDVLAVAGAGVPAPASVLVPVAGGPHSRLAARAAGELTETAGAWVDLLHVVDPRADESRRAAGRDQLAAAREEIPDAVDSDVWLLDHPDATAAIVEQTAYYDLTVLGAPRRGRLKRLVAGSTSEAIRADGDAVAVARRG